MQNDVTPANGESTANSSMLRPDTGQRAARILCIASIATYPLCLIADTFYFEGDVTCRWPGFSLVLVGWVAIFGGCLSWLANPLLFLAWRAYRSREFTACFYLAAIGFALIVSFLFHRTLIANEAGMYSKVAGYGTGYWLWLVSGALMTAAGFLQFYFAGRTSSVLPD